MDPRRTTRHSDVTVTSRIDLRGGGGGGGSPRPGPAATGHPNETPRVPGDSRRRETAETALSAAGGDDAGTLTQGDSSAPSASTAAGNNKTPPDRESTTANYHPGISESRGG